MRTIFLALVAIAASSVSALTSSTESTQVFFESTNGQGYNKHKAECDAKFQEIFVKETDDLPSFARKMVNISKEISADQLKEDKYQKMSEDEKAQQDQADNGENVHFGKPFDLKNIYDAGDDANIFHNMLGNYVWAQMGDCLPHKCGKGAECVEKANDDFKQKFQVLWEKTLTKIKSDVERTHINTKQELGGKFWKQLNDCKHGCSCKNIYKEYDQLTTWQTELVPRIKQQTETLNKLIENEKTILTSCPSYICAPTFDNGPTVCTFDFSDANKSKSLDEPVATVVAAQQYAPAVKSETSEETVVENVEQQELFEMYVPVVEDAETKENVEENEEITEISDRYVQENGSWELN